MRGPTSTLGLIAGGGIFPLEIARSVAEHGRPLHVIMIDGYADAALKQYPHTVVYWSKLASAVKALKQARVRDVLLVGTMARPDLKTVKPDLGFFMSLPSIVRALTAGGDDALLRGILGLFESRGFKGVSVVDVAPELAIGDGALGRVVPDAAALRDIARGFELVAALGRYDIGQAAIVIDGAIEAIEGAEGTDRMLARTAERRRGLTASERGGVIVKRPKPGQDLRLDLPAIGPNTAEGAAAARLAGVAAMSGFVLVGHRNEMIARADALSVFVTGVAARPEVVPGAVVGLPPIEVMSRVKPRARLSRDIALGVNVMHVLTTFETGSALAVRGNRVIVIGAGESADEALSRVEARGTKRNGVAVASPHVEVTAALVEQVAARGLEGIAGLGTVQPDAIAAADRLKLFVAKGGDR